MALSKKRIYFVGINSVGPADGYQVVFFLVGNLSIDLGKVDEQLHSGKIVHMQSAD
jgi:hypothetical protein